MKQRGFSRRDLFGLLLGALYVFPHAGGSLPLVVVGVALRAIVGLGAFTVFEPSLMNLKNGLGMGTTASVAPEARVSPQWRRDVEAVLVLALLIGCVILVWQGYWWVATFALFGAFYVTFFALGCRRLWFATGMDAVFREWLDRHASQEAR